VFHTFSRRIKRTLLPFSSILILVFSTVLPMMIDGGRDVDGCTVSFADDVVDDVVELEPPGDVPVVLVGYFFLSILNESRRFFHNRVGGFR
jgi:hypothetical protein